MIYDHHDGDHNEMNDHHHYDDQLNQTQTVDVVVP